MSMTNEEIDAEIKRLMALKEQNNRAQAQTQTTENNNPADGIYNPADYISKITSKMNEAGYTDEQGNKKSYGRGDKFSKNLDVAKNASRRTGFEQDKDGTPLPETAYEWVTQQLNEARAKGPVSKYTLRAIENGAKVRYNVPSNFDISGKGWFGNSDAAMARAMNSMSYNGKTQQTQPAQTPKPAQTAQTSKPAQTAQTSKPAQTAQTSKPAQTAQTSKPAQTAQTPKPAQTQDVQQAQGLSDNLYNLYNKGTQAIRNGNGLNDDDAQFMRRYSKAAGSRKPEDLAFLTSENAKRYSDLVHKQNVTKKANKIEKLKQQLDIHKKIMAENPDRPDIQSAQQTHIDSITKDIQKLGGSVE